MCIRDRYQAIRIELNHELDVLRDNLDDMIDLLNPGGRICTVSYTHLDVYKRQAHMRLTKA